LYDTKKDRRPKASSIRPLVAPQLHVLQQGTTMVENNMAEQSRPKSNLCEECKLWLRPRVFGYSLGFVGREEIMAVHG
jgi:hypothetical protein